jgi:hypothetical protein
MLALSFNQFNLDLVNSQIGDVIKYSEYILVYPLLRDSSSYLLNLMIQMGLLLFLGYFSYGFIRISKIKNQEEITFKDFKKKWAFFYDIINKFLFLPTLGLSLLTFSCRTQL